MKDIEKKTLDLDQMEQIVGGNESLQVFLSRYKEESQLAGTIPPYVHPGFAGRAEMSIDLTAALHSTHLEQPFT